MEFSDLIYQSVELRNRYHELEIQNHGSEWTVQEDLLALSNDIGNLNRLVMTEFNRYYDETPYSMKTKLVENIWWLIELSNRLDVDLEKELKIFFDSKRNI